MKFKELLELVAEEPLFESSLLLAGDRDPRDNARQLSRWTRQKRLIQIRRGLYCPAPPYQKSQPHPFVLANNTVHASYVSLQSALAYYALIPEIVPAVSSVTTKRPGRWDTSLGAFLFRHIAKKLFFAYRYIEVCPRQYAFVASPEKALFDLLYFQPAAGLGEYIKELRLQNMEEFDFNLLAGYVESSGSSKLQNSVRLVETQLDSDEFEVL